ncbi:MAG: coproporphyrinogen-III oxidase family protein [Chloroflexota bacterium]
MIPGAAVAMPSEARPARRTPDPAPNPGPPEALYVHVPFCLSLCPYCDFVVVAGSAARGPRNRIGAFVAALRRELELRAEALDALWGPPGRGPRPALGSLYFGGGTPSLLPGEVLTDLIGLVRDRFGLTEGAEITLESNPGPEERGDARALVAAGVTRLSFGAQAFDSATLRALGRRHEVGDVRDAVAAAREAEVDSVSLDLLYDTPGATLAGWADALEAALALEPDHLSLYALTLDDPDIEGLTGATGDHLPVTRGARRWRARARPRQDDDRAADMYRHAVDRLESAGFHGYEISNWARPGHESRHNLGYWTRRPHAAVGPGAHAFDGATRRWNAARLDAYLAALTPDDGSPGHLPPGGDDPINALTAAAESVILGLRLARGIPVEAGERPPLAEHLGWAIGTGLLEPTPEDRLVLTARGRLLSNELFVRLI